MARYLLEGTMYLEEIAAKNPTTWSPEEQKNVEEYLEDVKKFKSGEPKAKRLKMSETERGEEIEEGIRLLVKFAGFDDISPEALRIIQNLFQLQTITASRRLSAAQRRKRDGLDIPFKSPLEWTLKLHGIQKVMDLKQWYDVTYWTRLHSLKAKLTSPEAAD